MDKPTLRFSIKSRLSGMPEKYRKAESRSACRRLREILPRDACVVCGYYPLPLEVDILPLLKDLLDKGYRIYLPGFESGRLLFRNITDFNSLRGGELAIPEPPKNAPLLDGCEQSYILVPGRAFDKSGNRLGRGNGGYDHWIANKRAEKAHIECIGVCFECQIVREVPIEAHDQRVDKVVTARGQVF